MTSMNNKLSRRHPAARAVVVAVLMSAHYAIAAPPATPPPPPPPDSGVLLDTVKPVPKLPPKETGNLIQAPADARPAMQPDTSLRVTLKSIHFSGVTKFSDAEMQALVKSDIGRELTFADLDAMTARVTKFYRDRGYFIARAYLPQQNLGEGTLEILVLEGHIGKVDVKYNSTGPRIAQSQLRGLVQDAVPPSKPVTVSGLERGMLLENDLPNMTARATLIPGASVGTSDLVLEANEAGWFSHDTIEADNAGSRYSGTGRLGGSANLVSPAGLGDLLSARILTSFDGFNYGRLSWTTPVTATGLKLGVSGTYTNYRLGGSLEPIGDHGDAQIYSIFSVYPIVRSRFFNLYETNTYEYKALYDSSNEGEISDREIKVVSLGLNGDETDTLNGGGLTTFSGTLGIGHLNILEGGSAAAADAITAQTAGSYRKVLLSGSRQQHVVGNWTVYASLSGQYASKNLDSSESFTFGGPSGVRAYPVGEAPADEGLLSTVELRYNMQAPAHLGSLQYQLFYDNGEVRLHKDPWGTYVSSGAPDRYVLSSAGIGANLYREDSLFVTAAVAHKIGHNPDPGLNDTDADGRHESVRFWLQAVKYW
jgi:hemolysin activation/secretion protein